MAYTRTWAEVMMLLGTRDSDEIDDAVREARFDLMERFADILYDVEADPWKIKIPGVNSDGTQSHLIHPISGVVFDNVGMNVDTARSVQPLAVGNSGTWAGPIPVPRGSVIKAIAFRVRRTTVGATVICRLIEVDIDGVRTVISNDAAPVAGAAQTVAVSGLNEEMSSTAIYYLEVFLQADGASVASAQFLWADILIEVAGL